MAEARPAPFFFGDHLALDFLNSVASPFGEPLDWIVDGADLMAWLDAARAVPVDVLARFRAQTGTRTLDAIATEARELRENFRVFVRRHAGKPLTRNAMRELGNLNELLGKDEQYSQVELLPQMPPGEATQALRLGSKRHWRTPDALLLPLAAAMGDLVCNADFSLVRRCEGSDCTLWFLDVSKRHDRRWCSMAVCGNRAKAAAHRARAQRGR
jgi:predicted RNA-binding Zn ribbon-like protein